MQPKGFMTALFDFSFTAFVTPKIIKILYVLATILVSLWTLVLILAAFNESSGFGVLMLVIGGPLFFLLAIVYARVFLELVIVFFRINGNVQELRDGRSVSAPQPAPAPELPPDVAPVVAAADVTPETRPEPAVTATTLEAPEPAPARFCENCGADRRPGGRFCTSCGQA
jgi:hypothetical protein